MNCYVKPVTFFVLAVASEIVKSIQKLYMIITLESFCLYTVNAVQCCLFLLLDGFSIQA